MQIRSLGLFFNVTISQTFKVWFPFANHWIVNVLMVWYSLLFTHLQNMFHNEKKTKCEFINFHCHTDFNVLLLIWMQNVPIIFQAIVCCCYWIVPFLPLPFSSHSIGTNTFCTILHHNCRLTINKKKKKISNETI